MSNPLIWLSGAQSEVLSRCPTDRPKYLGIGSAILLTAAVASTSMTFALTTALRASLPVALIFAIMWGLGIMSLDRWLVVSLQRETGVLGLARYLFLAGIRLALALLIGFIVSTPFVLEIFHPEIDNEIAVIHARLSEQFQKHPPLQAAIRTDQAEVRHFENLLKTGGSAPNPYNNPVVAGLVNQRKVAKAAVTHWYGVYNCQLYGKPFQGLTCVAGNGPAATRADARLKYYQRQVHSLTQRIRTEVNRLNQQTANGRTRTVKSAGKSLSEWQAKLIKDQNQQHILIGRFNKTNGTNGGLLIRLQALGDLADHNTTIDWARWLLFALFTVIECLPVLVKTLLNLGSATAYETMHKRQEQMWLDISDDTTVKKEQASRIEADSILAEAQQLADRRQSMIENVAERAVTAEQNVAIAWISDWESRQLRDVGRGAVPTGAAPTFRTRPRFGRLRRPNFGAMPPAADDMPTDEADGDFGNWYPPGAGGFQKTGNGAYEGWETMTVQPDQGQAGNGSDEEQSGVNGLSGESASGSQVGESAARDRVSAGDYPGADRVREPEIDVTCPPDNKTPPIEYPGE